MKTFSRFSKFAQNSLLVAFIGLIPCTSYSFSWSCWYAQKQWSPIISIGGGIAASSNVGTSQNFPIINPATDFFYNYSAGNQRQKATLFEGFLGGEWPVYQNVSIQVGADYIQSTAFAAKGTLVQGADIPSADTFSYNYYISTKQLLAEMKVLFNRDCFHPYLLLGAGVSKNRAYNYYTSASPFLTFTRMYANNTTDSFSYALGFGIDVNSTDHLRIGVGYRYVSFGKVALGNATINSIPVSGTLSQGNLHANELLAQLTWVV